MKKSLPGFFLIQVAIGLAILGAVSTIGVSKLTQYLKFQQIQKTEANKEKIFYALAGYVLREKRLPCPGDANGNEKKNCSSPELAKGIVPYQELGLIDAKDAKDGYGYYFTYAVDPALIEQCASLRLIEQSSQEENLGFGLENIGNSLLEDSPGGCFCKTKESTLTIALKNTTTSQKGAIVLISHGPEGRGAPYSDSPTMGEDETQNATTSDLQFISAPLSEKKGEEFAHQVFFITRDNLMSHYGRYPCYAGNKK